MGELQKAICNLAEATEDGGWFLGDFITPDHLRWYPNVIYGEDVEALTIRSPYLDWEGGAMLQVTYVMCFCLALKQLPPPSCVES